MWVAKLGCMHMWSDIGMWVLVISLNTVPWGAHGGTGGRGRVLWASLLHAIEKWVWSGGERTASMHVFSPEFHVGPEGIANVHQP